MLASCGWLYPAERTPPPLEPPPPPEMPPGADVVFITLDTTRADHLSVYGYPRETSPHLRRFAEDALVFERFIVPMATTLPSHLSMFSGLWPAEHGVLANLKHGGARYTTGASTSLLAEWALSHGYQTSAFISARVLRPETGIGAGFQTFDLPKRPERRAEPTIDRALSWLEEASVVSKPLFMWVHLFDPHNPYAPPPEHRNRFRGQDPDVDRILQRRRHAPTGTRPTGEQVVTEDAIPLYDAEIYYMDDQLGRLLQALQARPRWSETIVVIAGDHGEGLNQHGEPGHGLVWDEQLHAPLIVRVPDAPPLRVRTTLSAADILPTVFGLASSQLPPADAFIQGMTGQDVLHPRFTERPVLSQKSERQRAFGRPMVWTMTGPRFKCHLSEEDEALLFDLSFDPHELSPVDNPEQQEACLQALRDERIRQTEVHARMGGAGEAAMPADEIEALRALGYLGDDEEPGE